MMKVQTRCWAVMADERVAHLMRLERTPAGRIHVSLEETISDSWEDHEHGRPAALGEQPMSPGERGGHTFASRRHEDETRRARFAKEIAVWLERQVEECGVERIAVFAPPRMLGALRHAWTPRMAITIDEHQGELAQMDPGRLADHRRVRELIQKAGI